MSPSEIKEFVLEYRAGKYNEDHITAIQKALSAYRATAGNLGIFNNLVENRKVNKKVSVMFNALAQDLVDHITTDKVVDFGKYIYIMETNIPTRTLTFDITNTKFKFIHSHIDEFILLVNKTGLTPVIDLLEVLSKTR